MRIPTKSSAIFKTIVQKADFCPINLSIYEGQDKNCVAHLHSRF